MYITTTDVDYCPECGVKINAAGTNKDIKPKPGDISVCGECTSYLVFDDNLKLKSMTMDDIVDLAPDELYQLTLYRKQIQEFNAQK